MSVRIGPGLTMLTLTSLAASSKARVLASIDQVHDDIFLVFLLFQLVVVVYTFTCNCPDFLGSVFNGFKILFVNESWIGGQEIGEIVDLFLLFPAQGFFGGFCQLSALLLSLVMQTDGIF